MTDIPPGKARRVDDREENVIGQIQVVAQLRLGIENLRLVLTNRRILVVHMGKKGASALASVSFLGKYGLDRIEREKDGVPAKQAKLAVSVEEILGSDKDNFELRYEGIIHAELRRSGSSLGIVILTGDDKFQFTTAQDPRVVENLFRVALGSKLVGTGLR